MWYINRKKIQDWKDGEYNSGTVVYHNKTAYVCIQTPTTGEEPGKSEHWAEYDDIDGYIYSTPYRAPYMRQLDPDEEKIEIEERPDKFHKYERGWKPDTEKWLNVVARPKRNALLNEIDMKYCNPERWETMTAEEKKHWKTEKQRLRDFPEVSTYGTTISIIPYAKN